MIRLLFFISLFSSSAAMAASITFQAAPNGPPTQASLTDFEVPIAPDDPTFQIFDYLEPVIVRPGPFGIADIDTSNAPFTDRSGLTGAISITYDDLFESVINIGGGGQTGEIRSSLAEIALEIEIIEETLSIAGRAIASTLRIEDLTDSSIVEGFSFAYADVASGQGAPTLSLSTIERTFSRSTLDEIEAIETLHQFELDDIGVNFILTPDDGALATDITDPAVNDRIISAEIGLTFSDVNVPPLSGVGGRLVITQMLEIVSQDTPQQIPLPPAVVLLAAALGLLGGIKVRARRT